ncbi:hypothetical protein M885DRAFT_505348 [Pelagophyceae sp. CCMP2097]|nr:hypothetical protein M885DRAFT_505348 [Pelagophyceae sp. CCMP2097]
MVLFVSWLLLVAASASAAPSAAPLVSAPHGVVTLAVNTGDEFLARGGCVVGCTADENDGNPLLSATPPRLQPRPGFLRRTLRNLRGHRGGDASGLAKFKARADGTVLLAARQPGDLALVIEIPEGSHLVARRIALVAAAGVSVDGEAHGLVRCTASGCDGTVALAAAGAVVKFDRGPSSEARADFDEARAVAWLVESPAAARNALPRAAKYAGGAFRSFPRGACLSVYVATAQAPPPFRRESRALSPARSVAGAVLRYAAAAVKRCAVAVAAVLLVVLALAKRRAEAGGLPSAVGAVLHDLRGIALDGAKVLRAIRHALDAPADTF